MVALAAGSIAGGESLLVSACSCNCRLLADRECPELDPLPLGNVTTTGRFFGDTATYACEAGYHLVGLRVRSCQADGRWAGQPPSCKSGECKSSATGSDWRCRAVPALLARGVAPRSCAEARGMAGDLLPPVSNP